MLEEIRKNKELVKNVSIKFNYPKNPNDQGSKRHYDPVVGGVMLDLGVYVFQLVKEIGDIFGFSVADFDKEN